MPVGEDGFRNKNVEKTEYKKIESFEGEGDFCKTFVIYDEDHTLGNPLQHIIVHYPEVILCGYTVPHPMENKIHLRIQCQEENGKGKPAVELLRQGLMDLKKQNKEVLKMLKQEVELHTENEITE